MSDDARERILQAAREIFSRYGLKKTSLAEVAEAAHMGKSSIYYYFPSKEALFGAVGEAEFEACHRRVTEAVAKETTAADKLRAYMRASRDVLKRTASAYEVLFNEGIDHLPAVQELKRKAARLQQEQLAGLIADGVREGRFLVDDVESTARAMRLALMTVEDIVSVLHKDKQAEADLDRLTELLIRGLQA